MFYKAFVNFEICLQDQHYCKETQDNEYYNDKQHLIVFVIVGILIVILNICLNKICHNASEKLL